MKFVLKTVSNIVIVDKYTSCNILYSCCIAKENCEFNLLYCDLLFWLPDGVPCIS